jgi:hypothetical protein
LISDPDGRFDGVVVAIGGIVSTPRLPSGRRKVLDDRGIGFSLELLLVLEMNNFPTLKHDLVVNMEMTDSEQ